MNAPLPAREWADAPPVLPLGFPGRGAPTGVVGMKGGGVNRAAGKGEDTPATRPPPPTPPPPPPPLPGRENTGVDAAGVAAGVGMLAIPAGSGGRTNGREPEESLRGCGCWDGCIRDGLV